MPDSSMLDMLLRLGRQVRDAAQSEEWGRATNLIDRRTQAFQQLPDADEEGTIRSQTDRQKLEALIAQNESLAELFRSRQEEIADELAQVGDLRHAQHSYRENSTRTEVLSNNLTG